MNNSTFLKLGIFAFILRVFIIIIMFLAGTDLYYDNIPPHWYGSVLGGGAIILAYDLAILTKAFISVKDENTEGEG